MRQATVSESPFSAATVITVFALSIPVMSLPGCATTRQTVGGWFGTASPTPRATHVPHQCYANADNVPVLSEPTASANVVGHLALYERVTRLKTERGYAYVESTQTRVKGWVRISALIRHRRAIKNRATPAAAEYPTEPTAEPTIEPTATATEPLPEPTHTSAPARPQRRATPRGVAPSIFNPY